METETLLLLTTIGVVTLFVLGVPIFLVIGVWVVGASIAIDFTLANIGVTLFEGLNVFGLLALPLFILTAGCGEVWVWQRSVHVVYSLLFLARTRLRRQLLAALCIRCW